MGTNEIFGVSSRARLLPSFMLLVNIVRTQGQRGGTHNGLPASRGDRRQPATFMGPPRSQARPAQGTGGGRTVCVSGRPHKKEGLLGVMGWPATAAVRMNAGEFQPSQGEGCIARQMNMRVGGLAAVATTRDRIGVRPHGPHTMARGSGSGRERTNALRDAEGRGEGLSGFRSREEM